MENSIDTSAHQEHAKPTNIYSYKRDNIIREGDTVLVFEGPDAMKQVTMVKDCQLHNKFGNFPHNEIIDNYEYGSKVYSKNNRGWVHMLRPSSHLYTSSLN
jgi:tRNA (adenine57-N1/adenine58-N1)-methyltransferase